MADLREVPGDPIADIVFALQARGHKALLEVDQTQLVEAWHQSDDADAMLHILALLGLSDLVERANDWLDRTLYSNPADRVHLAVEPDMEKLPVAWTNLTALSSAEIDDVLARRSDAHIRNEQSRSEQFRESE